MHKNPTEFRKRFAAWKKGAKPYQYGIPYDDTSHNLDYDYARANQLGYIPDKTSHYPTRDYETGRYLKSPIHPTVTLGTYADMGMDYDVWYNKDDKSLYSQPSFTSTYKDRLPAYRDGKEPWGLTDLQKAVREWVEDWKTRTTPAARSKVIQKWNATGQKPKPESSKQYTQRRVNEETKRTWLSDAADIAHGVGEGILSLHPYTAIPYFGAKVGLDILNDNVSWETALNASVPLFHMAPMPASAGTVINDALEYAANAGSKTARNFRIGREFKNVVSNSNPILEIPNTTPRTMLGDVEINNPRLNYRVGTKDIVEDFNNSGIVRAGEINNQKSQVVKGILLRKKTFNNPMFKEGGLWYQPSEELNGLLTTAEPMAIATKYANAVENDGVFTIAGKTFVNDFGGRRILLYPNQLNQNNTSAYIFEPEYGYRKISALPSTLSYEDAVKNLRYPVKSGTKNSTRNYDVLIKPLTSQRQQLALPSPEYLVPEATYTGKTPKRTIDLDNIENINKTKLILKDIANDPNDYTFKEIDDALNAANLADQVDKDVIHTVLPSSGKTIQLGNNVLQELLKVNAILERYGYDRIPEGMDDVATREALMDRIKLHRTFGRGVYLKPRGSRMDNMITKLASEAFGVPYEDVTAEMKLKTAATHTVARAPENGRLGLHEFLKAYGLDFDKYDAIYTSNADEVLAGYSNPGYGGGSRGKAYFVRMPINDSDPSASLTQLWLNNEFPLLDAYNPKKLTDWRKNELPFMLKTGKSFEQSMSSDVKSLLNNINKNYQEDVTQIKLIADQSKLKNYSDTHPSKILERTYDVDAERMYETISNNNKFLQLFGQVINPVVNGKVGIDDLEFVPGKTKFKLKYPRAYDKFTEDLANVSDVARGFGMGDFDLSLELSKLVKSGIISEKQYKAFKNSFKSEYPQPDKYFNIASMVKKALYKYIKSLGKERSADAFARKKSMERHNYGVDVHAGLMIDRITREKLRNLKKITNAEKNRLMQEAGVKPNYDTVSKDGRRIFTTEGIRLPDPSNIEKQHYAIIGPRNTKMLDIVKEYKPKSHRNHHGHEGNYTSGLSRNLGSVMSPLFIGPAAYDYYNKRKNNTQNELRNK